MIISPRYIIKMPANLILCCYLLFGVSTQVLAVTPDSEQPVNIRSNKANFDHGNDMALYTGNVTVDQGSRHLLSDTLTIKRDKDNKIKVIIATGKPATFRSQSDPKKEASTGSANTIKYYPQQDKVDLLDNAELIQNGDKVQGPILNYNFVTGNLKTTSSVDQRATFILQPKRP